MPDNNPDTLADPANRARRRALLAEPHARPLAAYVAALRRRTLHDVPDFDPLDGGTAARLLFVLEKPGPRVALPAGSGFVSRDTPDPTAAALHRFCREAGIPRRETVVWNTCPWWDGTIRTTPAAFRAGAAEYRALLPLLPALRSAILVGNAAALYASPYLTAAGLPLFRSVHTGNQARIGPASRDRWRQIPQIWRNAWLSISD